MPIYSDLFDSYSNGSNLTGQGSWTADTHYVISNAQSVSSPNSVKFSGATSAFQAFVSQTDTNAGYAFASADFWIDAAHTTQVGPICRATGIATSAGSNKNYNYHVRAVAAGDSGQGVKLFKVVHGTASQVGSTVGTTALAIQTWYNIQLSCTGSSIQVQVQRLSDNNYLTSAGAWQAGQAYCISATDSSVAGVGQAGIRVSTASGGIAYIDNFDFEQIALPTVGLPYYIFEDINFNNYILIQQAGQGAPGVPINVAAVGGNTTVILSWTPADGLATSFNVRRAPHGTTSWTEIDGLPLTTTSYTFTGLSNGSAYDCEVEAVNAAGVSGWSALVTATPTASPPPGTPVLNSLVAQDATDVTFNWTPADATQTGFNLQISAISDSGPWTSVATGLSAALRTYTWASAVPSTQYWGQVQATNANGSSNWSASMTCTTPPAGAFPAVPSSLTATWSTDHVHLTWTDNSGGTAITCIEGSECTTANSPFGYIRWVPLIDIPAGQTTANIYQCDAYPVGARTLNWAFRATAKSTSADSSEAFSGTGQTISYSNAVTLNIPVTGLTAPADPASITITPATTVVGIQGAAGAGGSSANISAIAASSTSIHLEWLSNSENEAQWDVYYNTTGTAPSGATSPTISNACGPGVTYYNLTGLSATTTYFIWVRATNAAGSSNWVQLDGGSGVATYTGATIYSPTGGNPPWGWTAQQQWKAVQSQADASAGNKVWAGAVWNMMTNFETNNYPNNNQTEDGGISAAWLFQATGTTTYRDHCWNLEFQPGQSLSITNSGGVGVDVTVSTGATTTSLPSNVGTALSSAPPGIGLQLNPSTGVVNDLRVLTGRIQFLSTTTTVALRGALAMCTGCTTGGTLTAYPALPATPVNGDVFQLIPYPYQGAVDKSHTNMGFCLWMVGILWPGLNATQQRQITNMMYWWGDALVNYQTQTSTASGGASWFGTGTLTSHDDTMNAAFVDLLAGANIPSGSRNQFWWSYGPTATFSPGVGTIAAPGQTSSALGYVDRSTRRNLLLQYAMFGRGGEYNVGSQYNSADLQYIRNFLGVGYTMLGTEYFPEWRMVLRDYLYQAMYSMSPDYNQLMVFGDWQNITGSQTTPFAGRYITASKHYARPGGIAGELRGRAIASYLYQWVKETNVVQTSSLHPYMGINMDLYPTFTDWRSAFSKGLVCRGNNSLYYQNGWASTSSLFASRTIPENHLDHPHYAWGDIHLYRKGVYALTNPVHYTGKAFNDSAPITNGQLHCGLGLQWVSGAAAQEKGKSDAYLYGVTATHGPYYSTDADPFQPSTITTYQSSKIGQGSGNITAFPGIFCLEGTRSIFYLPGTDSPTPLSETIIVCDRMEDVDPHLLTNFSVATGYYQQQFVDTTTGAHIATVAASPAPTATTFAAGYKTGTNTGVPPIGSRVDVLTGTDANSTANLISTVASVVVATGGINYAVNDVIALTAGTTITKVGSKVLTDDRTVNGGAAPATFTVSSVTTAAISAFTVTNVGSYTTVPANPVSVTGGTGTGATFTVHWTGTPATIKLSPAPALKTVGSGYTVGDVLTLVGGTFTTAGQLTVTTVSNGSITGVSVTTAGRYTIQPTNPATTTAQLPSTGQGAQLTVTWNSGYNTTTGVSTIYPALSSALTAGDTLTISTHQDAYLRSQNAPALQAAAWHSPAAPTTTTGIVTRVHISTAGSYTVTPGNPVSVTGGTGSGATFTCTFAAGALTSVTLAAPGSGYTAGDVLTLSGGTSTVAAQITVDGIGVSSSWTAASDATQNVRFQTMHPSTAVVTTYDECDLSQECTYLGTDYDAGGLEQSEINYTNWITPSPTAFPSYAFNAIIHVMQVWDNGATTLTNTAVNSNSNEAKGLVVSRTGLNDVVVMFSTRQYYRVHQSGFTFSFFQSTATATVYICDLDPSRTSSYTLDGGGSVSLTNNFSIDSQGRSQAGNNQISLAGIATISVSGTGQHTIALTST